MEKRDSERIAALRIGTIEAVKAWAVKYKAPLFTFATNEDLLLLSIHEARANESALPRAMRRESQRWLDTNKARIMQGADHGSI